LFLTLTFPSFTPPFTACCTASAPHSIASEAYQTLRAADEPIINENKSDSRMKSDVLVTSSSSNMAAIKIAEKTIPDMDDYWKKSTLTEADRKACHFTGWQNNGLESSIAEVNVPMVDGSTIVCFKSHLIAGFGLPPSMFLVAIMNFLGCELVHFNPSAIADLSCFTMLCECWLEIVLDTSLFW
jgi:hypothetical protein